MPSSRTEPPCATSTGGQVTAQASTHELAEGLAVSRSKRYSVRWPPSSTVGPTWLVSCAASVTAAGFGLAVAVLPAAPGE